jgi:hypothetical protein
LGCLIEERTVAAMVWCGMAIAFKAQAVFIAPVIVGAMIGQRTPWWQWGVPPLVFLMTLVPPWLLGWPGTKLLTVYLEQAKWDHIPGRLANPWMFGTVFADHASRHWFWLGYVAAGIAAALLSLLAMRNARNPRMLILLAALAGTALPFLLPKMLERYYFLGDVMTLALFLTVRTRATFLAALAVQGATILSYVSAMFFYYEPYPTLIGAIVAAGGLAILFALVSSRSLGRDSQIPLVAFAASKSLRTTAEAEVRRPLELTGSDTG